MTSKNPEKRRRSSPAALWVPFVLIVGALALVLITTLALPVNIIPGAMPPPVLLDVAAAWSAAWFLAYLLLFVQQQRFRRPSDIRSSTGGRVPVKFSTIASATMLLVGYLLIVPVFFTRYPGCDPRNGTCSPPAPWTLGLFTYLQDFELGLLIVGVGIVFLVLASRSLSRDARANEPPGNGEAFRMSA
jgi:hypothetical protein